MFHFEDQNLIQYSLYNASVNDNNIPADLLEEFLMENPKTGYLQFQIFRDSAIYGRLPVPNAKITINGLLNENLAMSEVFISDANGKTEPIPLPTVSWENSLFPNTPQPYSTYNAIVETPDDLSVNVTNIPIFENITSIQAIKLLPKSELQNSTIVATQPRYLNKGR